MESPYWGEGIMSAPVMSQTSSLRTGKAALRTVRKLERPRPLKLTSDSSSIGKQIIETGSFSRSSTDEVLQEVETVVKHINNGNFDGTVSAAIVRMCNQLRAHGTQLETKFKDQLDRYFVSFRNACREEKLDMSCRLRLLEIIELRAMGWRFNENLTNYYKRKVVDSDQIADNAFPQSTSTTATLSSTTPSLTPSVTLQNQMFFQPLVPNVAPASTVSYLSPGEVLKSSGKFAKPTKIPGKNYYKDEIVIRNSDSGKVMGIKGRRVHMIEEFSDTVISFQRVSQGAKDRLVQITGPKEESIERSKQLIEETIRRNASPVRETPKELFGSDSCSSLNSNNSEEGISNVPLHLGNQKGHLLHSFSMNDASIGEYQYTVTVDKDTLKISGAKLDIVRTAKLVLEEYFAGDAERSKHDADNPRYGDFSEPVFITNNQEYSGYSEGNICDELIPVQQSPASSDIKSYLECNGCSRSESDRIRHLSSSSSDSEEGTFKASDSLSVSESDSGVTKESIVFPMDSPYSPALSSSGSITVIREPLFPNSSKEAFQLAESVPNFQSLCAKVRRAKFAKTTEQLKDKTDSPTPPSPSTPNSSASVKLSLSSSPVVESTGETEDNGAQLTRKSCISYTRDFLLSCAASPFSRVTPKDLPRIIREAPYVLKKTTEPFEPEVYKKLETGLNFYQVMRSNSSIVNIEDEIV